MKGDFSRHTFDPARHYSSVRMQQGRVQLDADWNEQADIARYRDEIGALDLIGGCGGPLHAAAFGILPDPAAVGGFRLGAGRYYVDGILCENEIAVAYGEQPDLPGAPVIGTDQAAGFYLVYLDVWQRHLTALDDPRIRETALGGPDTATRTRTIWQVRWAPAGGLEPGVDCRSGVAAYDEATAPSTGRLRAREQQEDIPDDPCLVPPRAGFRGLENQLYRVEIHEGGAPYDLTPGTGVFTITAVDPAARQVTVATGSWAGTVGQAVEIFFAAPGSDPMAGTLATIAETNGRRLTLNADLPALDPAVDQPRLRRVAATYKWSRDNGSVVSAIRSVNAADRTVAVASLGPDTVLDFKPGQWVEIGDDVSELNGRPGRLAQIEAVAPATNTITLRTAPIAVDPARHPKLRRWDGVGAVKIDPPAPNPGYVGLEDGVQVRFEAGDYRTGDYWLIPARTATAEGESGTVEWPREGGDPAALPPAGIRHHYCRLAVLRWDGAAIAGVEDCRCLFAPTTELNSLVYVSGAGQEATPNLTQPPGSRDRIRLGLPLVAGIANGQCRAGETLVRFRVVQGEGQVVAAGGAPTGNEADVPLDGRGLAACDWYVDGVNQHQLVEARLLGEDGQPVQLPIFFNASLSVASEVAFDPEGCAASLGSTVQTALDQLSHQLGLYIVSGNGQEALPGETLAPLVVLAASPCGLSPGNRVQFTAAPGNGTVSPQTVITDGDGLARCQWTLDPNNPGPQVVEARLVQAYTSPPVPVAVQFTANLSTAAHVAYDPRACDNLEGANTVQEAIDRLCRMSREDDPGVHITDILVVETNNALRNDTDLTSTLLADGIRVICDRPIADQSLRRRVGDAMLTKPTCFVTLQIPYPLSEADRSLWGPLNGPFGFQSIVVDAEVAAERLPDGRGAIRWTPTIFAREWLQLFLFRNDFGQNSTRGARVLAHLTLKGNFLWAEGDPDLYLDGESFGVPADDGRTNLRQARLGLSGDGRRGGDFEMWFWLVPTPLRIISVGVSPTTIVLATSGSAVGTVRLNLPAPVNTAIALRSVLINAGTPAMTVRIRPTVIVLAGAREATFPIDAGGGNGSGRTAEYEIIAALGDSEQRATLRLVDPLLT